MKETYEEKIIRLNKEMRACDQEIGAINNQVDLLGKRKLKLRKMISKKRIYKNQIIDNNYNPLSTTDT